MLSYVFLSSHFLNYLTYFLFSSKSHPLTELSPLIRLGGTKQSSLLDYPTAPLTFSFISALDIATIPSSLPQRNLHFKTPSSPTILSHQIPEQHQRFQDVLPFRPGRWIPFFSSTVLNVWEWLQAAASVQALRVQYIAAGYGWCWEIGCCWPSPRLVAGIIDGCGSSCG